MMRVTVVDRDSRERRMGMALEMGVFQKCNAMNLKMDGVIIQMI